MLDEKTEVQPEEITRLTTDAKTCGWATASLVLGIIPLGLLLLPFLLTFFPSITFLYIFCLFASPLALILSLLAIGVGINALRKIKKSNDVIKGKDKAIAGIILAGIWIVLVFVCIFIWFPTWLPTPPGK